MKPERTGRLAHIDGLRAVSILLVLGYHLAPDAVRSGFVGVDVFFVISGFLITGILRRELGEGSFRLSAFYARRVRRIFPALLPVLAGTFLAGWFVLLPSELVSLGAHLAGGAGFVSNFVLWREAGYFDADIVRKPLMHLWSLGVEEQFYIAWPLFLMLAWRARRFGAALLALAMLASFTACVWLTLHDPTAAFYAPWARFWELALGSLLAWTSADGLARSTGRWSGGDALSLVGLGLVIASALWAHQDGWGPAGAAVAPTVGACLLLVSGGEAVVNRLVLAARPAAWIGRLSYSLYLWHWPLLSFATILLDAPPSGPLRVGMALTALALAAASARFIERPFLGQEARPRAVAGLCVAMGLIGSVGAVTAHLDGFPARLPEEVRALTALANEPDWRHAQGCFLQPDQHADAFGPTCVDRLRRPLVIVWGDSYGAALDPGMLRLSETTGIGLGMYTSTGCPPVLGHVSAPDHPLCTETNDFVFSQISALKPEVVVLHSRWTEDLPLVAATVSALRAAGVGRVVVLGAVPQWTGGLPQTVLQYARTHTVDRLIPVYSKFNLRMPPSDASLRDSAGSEGVFISAADVLCTSEGCRTRLGVQQGDLTSFDVGHFTEKGSIDFVRRIAPAMLGDDAQAR